MAKKHSKAADVADATARFEERIFFPGFFRELSKLFGRDVQVAVKRFTAFWFLFIATKSGKRSVGVEEFIGMAPALRDGSLVRWIVRKDLATRRKGRLSLCDNDGVRERRRFVRKVARTFKSNRKRECPGLWRIMIQNRKGGSTGQQP